MCVTTASYSRAASTAADSYMNTFRDFFHLCRQISLCNVEHPNYGHSFWWNWRFLLQKMKKKKQSFITYYNAGVISFSIQSVLKFKELLPLIYWC